MSRIPLPLGLLFYHGGEAGEKEKSLAIFHFYKSITCENKNDKYTILLESFFLYYMAPTIRYHGIWVLRNLLYIYM